METYKDLKLNFLDSEISQQQSFFLTKDQVIKTIEAQKPKPTRILCLDVYRGLTMLGMILVDSMGDFDHLILNIYIWPLNETEWNGISTADCIFPAFIFIMGVAIPLAIKRDMDKKQFYLKLIKRCIILFILGMLLNAQSRFPRIYQEWPFIGFRVMGVLQRLSICYLVTAIVFYNTEKIIHQIIILVCFNIVYLGFMYGYKVPNYNSVTQCGKGCLELPNALKCNFGAYLDQLIFGTKYMFRQSDPEGVFTTLSALTNCFMGMYYCQIMRKTKDMLKLKKYLLLIYWGAFTIFLISVGLLIMIGVPLNKKIWTPSFAFVTSGFSGLTLTLCYGLVDLLDKKIIKEKGINMFLWLGMNPLFVFVGMIFLDNILMNNIKFYYDGQKMSAWKFLNDYGFNQWIHDEYASSLIFSCLNAAFWISIAYQLYKNKIFIKL